MPPTPRKFQAEVSAYDQSPPAYDGGGRASSDPYLPEDEDLSDDDLTVLNTDYNLQRHLTFFAPNQVPIDSRQPRRPAHPQQNRSAEVLPTMTGNYSPTDSYVSQSNRPSHTFHRNAYAYQQSNRPRPLIDYITNEWKTTPYTYPSTTSFDLSEAPTWVQICFAPRVKRSMLIFLVLFLLVWGNWKTWAGDHQRLRASSKQRLKNPGEWFGVNMGPEFLDVVQVETLADDLLPNMAEEKRLIIIGDVHGCNDELVALLARLQYDAGTDHLVFTGDMISKGPSSTAVVDLAISARASCVRGNHEDRVLLTYRDLSEHPASTSKTKKPLPPAPGIPEGASVPEQTADGGETLGGDESLDESRGSLARLDLSDRHLARQLNKRQIDYLSQCPVILDIGHIAGMGNVHVVHAGLVPGVRLERQDPMSAMHMRTVDLETHVPSSSGKGTAWYKVCYPLPLLITAAAWTNEPNTPLQLWNKYQSLLSAEKRSTVIYGHDSHRGLQLQRYSKGIDTGCVRGGKLSALIIDKDSRVEGPKVVTVGCKDYRQGNKEGIKDIGGKGEGSRRLE
ncbi:MAG: hypothetical protein Q9163_005130 [Psora crenata]